GATCTVHQPRRLTDPQASPVPIRRVIPRNRARREFIVSSAMQRCSDAAMTTISRWATGCYSQGFPTGRVRGVVDLRCGGLRDPRSDGQAARRGEDTGMCGIAGWGDYSADVRRDQSALTGMGATMACRGPGAQGTWTPEPVAFGHGRLAVIDIEGGRQPMRVDVDGRTVAALTYSGEVYNYQELRAELAGRGHRFRTESDTEVVLHAWLEWGEDFA